MANRSKIIYFVRHGESTANKGLEVQDSTSQLTDLGFKQAKFIGQRLINLPVDLVISSDYKRAEQTAEEINKILNKELIFSNLFTERGNPSSLVGKSKQDPNTKNIAVKMESNYGDFAYRFEDAESGGDLLTRSNTALDFLISRPENHIVVVTHGFFLRFLMAHVLGGVKLVDQDLVKFLKAFRTNNTGVTIVEYNPDFTFTPWALRAWNDHAHLSDLVQD